MLDELAQYLEDAWKPIIDTDVDGVGSTPVQIDRDRPVLGARFLARRTARAIFVASAPTLHGAHKGVEVQRVRLGTAIPGDTVGSFGSALQLLVDRSTYLYVDQARYWYDTQANITRTARDYAERLVVEDVWPTSKAGYGGGRPPPDCSLPSTPRRSRRQTSATPKSRGS